ncbi:MULTISPECIES: LysR family transcriptional regulator [Mesorhizobium]|uniref:LysR family transcriptional regulator n=1 Tax=Mesorhizobium neociceri TaxID=1307853 RepID=A0A838B0E1_9HYPH|nr:MULTISPECIES: LysR family transcriptional regulator [Mesorhizobium]MBA1139467.1 LysR family transcriptional regulator [Mesorhizobium neociceri]
MRLKGLDLNLLVVLDALLTERNLTTAARRINLSQPAMSAAVARLRDYFRDELFTMSGRERFLTPRAETLAPAVRAVLGQIQGSIISLEPFNPAQSDRHFRVVLSDFAIFVFFQKVVERVAREAPAVSFELLPLDDDPFELIRRGDVDFLIVPEMFMSSAHPKMALFDDRLVCVGCPSNKQLPRHLAFEKYLSMKHVAVKFGHAQKPVPEDWLLHEHGFRRRVEIVVQGFSMVPPLVTGTDRLAVMPLRLVKHFEKTIPLRVFDLATPLPAFTEAVQWPAIHNSDPASIWLRDIMLQEASQMATPSKTPAHRGRS